MTSKASVPPTALTVADVKKAFAAEGLSLRALHEAGTVTLIPESAGSAPFAAIVYDAGSASKPLGIRVSNAGNVVVRVRNVLVSYPPAAEVTAQVQAAVERLRKTGTR